MDRRAFLGTLTGGLLAAPLAAEGQATGKVPRIGVLSPGYPPPSPDLGIDGFRLGLRELGYVESQNIVVEYRWTEGRLDRQAALVSELIQLPVDALVVPSTSAAMAARRETASIAIVSASAGALVEAGVVTSLARPGGNVTGLTALVPELSAKRLALLKEAVPKLSRVAALVGPYSLPSLSGIYIGETEAAARAVGVELQLLRVREPADLEGAFQAATRGGAGGMILLANPFLIAHGRRVAELALKHRIATVTGDPGLVEAGGLMRYGVDYRDMWRRASGYVDRILKGAKPGDLPIEQPTKFELFINLKTAKALGLTIPQSLLQRADQVIE
jgi:ABC-type uncharacterized transport system substrate-binding protein